MKRALSHVTAAALGGLLVYGALSFRTDPGKKAGGLPAHPAAERRSDSLPPAKRSPLRKPRSLTLGDRVKDEELHAILTLLGTEVPTRAQLMDYVASRDGHPEALLAAALILDDFALLREAAAKNPRNAQFACVLAQMAARHGLPLGEQLNLAKRFLKLQLDNALGSYLTAARLIESEDTTAALNVLRASVEQGTYGDYGVETILAVEDAYRGTGSSPYGARLRSIFYHPVPHELEMFRLGKLVLDEEQPLPPEDAEDYRNLLAGIGSRMIDHSSSGMLMTETVGLALQRFSLAGLPDDAPSSFEGLTVAEAQASLKKRRSELSAIVNFQPDDFHTYSREQLEGFSNRFLVLGELEATRWLRAQTPKSLSTPGSSSEQPDP